MGYSNCYRHALGCLSILTFLVGAVFVVVGVLFKFSSGLLGNDVIALFNKIQYEGVQLGLVGEGLAYLMMVFGGIMIFIAIIGACGAWKRSRCCLMTFAGFLVFILVIELLVVGLWIFCRQRTDQWLRGQMMTSLKSYAGPEATDLYSKGWNELFMKARCCGVNDQFKDGGTNSDFLALPTTWTSATNKVPPTCCQGVTSGTISAYDNTATCTTPPTNFYTQGCYDRVADTIGVYSLIIFITSAIAMCIQVPAIVLSCVVYKHSNTKVSDASLMPKTKPPPYVSGNSGKPSSNWDAVRKEITRNKLTEGRY